MGRKNRPVHCCHKKLPDVTKIHPPKRMDIWYAHLRENTGTSVQEGSRPVLVIRIISRWCFARTTVRKF